MGPNELLYRLSATQTGSWAQFRSAVEDLMPDGEETGKQKERLPLHQIVRFNLQQLGHVEFQATGSNWRWQVAPPVLALSEHAGRPIGILCGARLPSLEAAIDVGTAITPERSQASDHPDVVRFLSQDTASLEALARNAGIATQPHAALSLISCLPPVTDLAAWHSTASEMPFGRETKVQIFRLSKRNCEWAESSASEAKQSSNGLFRFTRFQRRQHYLVVNRACYRVQGQIGNYFLAATRRRQLLSYNRATQELTVLDLCRPPLLVDRALILCSGFLPSYDSTNGTLRYSNIAEGIAGRAAAILCQQNI